MQRAASRNCYLNPLRCCLAGLSSRLLPPQSGFPEDARARGLGGVRGRRVSSAWRRRRSCMFSAANASRSAMTPEKADPAVVTGSSPGVMAQRAAAEIGNPALLNDGDGLRCRPLPGATVAPPPSGDWQSCFMLPADADADAGRRGRNRATSNEGGREAPRRIDVERLFSRNTSAGSGVAGVAKLCSARGVLAVCGRG